MNLATPFSAPSAEEIRESGSDFQSLMVSGKATYKYQYQNWGPGMPKAHLDVRKHILC